MKQFIITEQEKYNILKQYGLFEQEELLYPAYANKTMSQLKLSDVYKPTWKYAKSQRSNIFLIDINFPYSKTKIVKINNQYSLGNTDFKNVNNIVRISGPKNFEIESIEITDFNDKKYTVNQKNNNAAAAADNDNTKAYPYLRPGDKYYMPPTGPFAPSLNREEIKYLYEPNIPIPGLGKMSFMDIAAGVLNFVPYGQIFSALIEISSGYYFLQKGDKYEDGLRLMFLFIPFGELPIVRKIGKNAFIGLLKKLKDLSKNIGAINRLTKKDFDGVIELFKEFIKNGKTLKEKIQRGLKRINLFVKWVKAISALKLKDFLLMLYKYNKSNPTSFGASSGKLLFVFTKMLAKVGIIIGSWEELWALFGSEKDKYQRELNKNLEELESNSMSNLDSNDMYSIFNAISTNPSLLNYVSNQS